MSQNNCEDHSRVGVFTCNWRSKVGVKSGPCIQHFVYPNIRWRARGPYWEILAKVVEVEIERSEVHTKNNQGPILPSMVLSK